MRHVARLDEIRDDRPLQVDFLGEKRILVRDGETVRAFSATCPHAGAALAKGAVCGGRIVCPWHKAAFDARTGALLRGPALAGLTQYEVEVTEEGIRIGEPVAAPAPGPVSGPEGGVLIVGNGAAGSACAAELRRRGYRGPVTMASRVAGAPVDRTALSKAVTAGAASPQEAPSVLDEDWYRANDVRFVHAEVVRLNAERGEASLAYGEALRFGAALVATGGEPRRPEVPGADLVGIHVLRERADASAIEASLARGGPVVVVGGGFVAMESAFGFAKRGLSVTVVAREELPFADRLGEGPARGLAAAREEAGIRFRQGRLAGFAGNGRVEAVRLEGGEQVPAATVLVGFGVAPRTDLVSGVEREKDGGIVVDRLMRAAPRLWVAGDIAAFPFGEGRLRIEHWAVAAEHGRIAAASMLGQDAPVDEVPFFWTAQGPGRYDYLGHAEQWDETRTLGDPKSPPFAVLLGQGGRLAAAIACQRDRGMARLSVAMRGGIGLEEAATLLEATEE